MDIDTKSDIEMLSLDINNYYSYYSTRRTIGNIFNDRISSVGSE